MIAYSRHPKFVVARISDNIDETVLIRACIVPGLKVIPYVSTSNMWILCVQLAPTVLNGDCSVCWELGVIVVSINWTMIFWILNAGTQCTSD